MTTQKARKGQPGHVREDRERVGKTPPRRYVGNRWTGRVILPRSKL